MAECVKNIVHEIKGISGNTCKDRGKRILVDNCMHDDAQDGHIFKSHKTIIQDESHDYDMSIIPMEVYKQPHHT